SNGKLVAELAGDHCIKLVGLRTIGRFSTNIIQVEFQIICSCETVLSQEKFLINITIWWSSVIGRISNSYHYPMFTFCEVCLEAGMTERPIRKHVRHAVVPVELW